MRSKFEELVRSRTSPLHHIERASILLSLADGKSATETADRLGLYRSKIYRCIDRVSQVGVERALDDLPRSGRSPTITPEATVWVLALACQNPHGLGYSYELWTHELLVQHIRANCVEADYPSLSELGQGTLSKILNKHELKPHKIKYYLEARDPDFDRKTVDVLKVYKLAEIEAAKRALLAASDQVNNAAETACTRKRGSRKQPKEKPRKLLTRLAEYIEKQKSEAAAISEPAREQAALSVSTDGIPPTKEPDCKIPPAEISSSEGAPAGEHNSFIPNNACPLSAERGAHTIGELLDLARSCDRPLSVAVLSYDEKPGIQAIKNKARDLPPVPGKYTSQGRDYEYIRCGTVSLLAGTDLGSGNIHALLRERHRSSEFVEYLKMLDRAYPQDMKLVILLDNHSAHLSKETREYLATVPGRFLFVFTPVHASWLNIIESFFSKMTRSVLRGMRVSSLNDLKQRLNQYIIEVNQKPTVFRWRYGLELVAA